MSDKKLALAAQLAGQLVKHYVGPQENYEKETNIVTARNGIFRVVKTPVALYKTQISKMEKDYVVPGALEMEEGVQLNVPKIPFKYWLMALKFYRDIHTKDGTEASVLFFWNTNNEELPSHYNPTETEQKQGKTQGAPIKGLIEDGQLIVYCPRQKNSSGLSEFHTDGMVQYLREHTTPLLETHSHHTMDAFFSGTDDANENMNQFYAVYGKIKDEKPKYVFRFCSGNHKVKCDPAILFDFPQVKVTTTIKQEFVGADGVDVEGFAPTVETEEELEAYAGPWPDVEYPDDWMEQHTKSTPSYGAGRTGYQGSGARYSGYGSYYGGYQGGYGSYYDDYEDGYLGGAAANGYGTGLKKNDKEGVAEDEEEIETASALVTLQAEAIINNMSHTELKALIHELSDYGYDWIIAEALEEQKFNGYK